MLPEGRMDTYHPIIPFFLQVEDRRTGVAVFGVIFVVNRHQAFELYMPITDCASSFSLRLC